jgi:hypothetical protein
LRLEGREQSSLLYGSLLCGRVACQAGVELLVIAVFLIVHRWRRWLLRWGRWWWWCTASTTGEHGVGREVAAVNFLLAVGIL